MNQKKIGLYLKDLRKQKGLTQEEFSELLGVSNRSISRWENGVNMPTLELLLEIAKYYEVSMDEILDGEEKPNKMDKETETTLSKVADYDKELNKSFSRRMSIFFVVALVALIAYMIIDTSGLRGIDLYDGISGFLLGLVAGVILLGILYANGRIFAFRERKLKLFNKLKGTNIDK